jgi:hypothetical protein
VSPEQTETPTTEGQPLLSAQRLGTAVLMLAILVYGLFVLVKLVLPARWAFSIEAKTQVVEIELPTGAEMQRQSAETRWRIDGAVICSLSDLGLPEEWLVRHEPLNRDAPRRCGRRWQEWRIPAAFPEQVLRLDGGTVAAVQVLPEGGIALSLRRDDDKSLGTFSVVGVQDDVRLGAALNLIWPEVPARSLTLPFSGAVTIGRAVSWSGTTMLLEGTAVVYTADESADERTTVDSARLILGDQVRLGPQEPGRAWPRGFLHIANGDDALRVVAFGHAPGLRIDRFGESGYGFRPGPIRKLVSDPSVAFWGSILVLVISLVAALRPVFGEDHGDGRKTSLPLRLKLWLLKRRGS